MNITDAIADKAIFGTGFTAPSWATWRAFLAALFGLPMDDDGLNLYRALTGRKTPPAAQFTEAALIVGRRGGKSRILALIAVYLATLRDYAPHLAPGEVATVAVIAADRKQARSIFRYTAGLLHAAPMLAALIEAETDEAITLRNRVVIEIGTASFRSTRGYTFAAVLADEIAFWRADETSANPDVEILRALRPGLATLPGAMLLLASSPYAKRGALYAAYRRHHGKDDARVLVWKADTATMNPRIDPAIIAEAYADDPEAARAEYGAEFRDDLADFLTREAVDGVTAWGRRELPPEPGVTYAAFCDPSGGASDAMTLAIAHLTGNVAVLDSVLEIRPPFDPDIAVAECAALLRRFGISRVVGDRYAGQWPVSRFAAHGITFEQSARPKNDLYHDFLPLVNAKRVELLENARLTAQLCGLERRTARSGKDSIDHTPGGHDDVANAVAGVLVGLDLDRRPALIRQDQLTDSDGPAAHPSAQACFATVWVTVDGMGAFVLFSYAERAPAPLIVLDFDVIPWTAALVPDVARRLDAACEAARRPDGAVHAILHVPGQLEAAAFAAMQTAFAERMDRHDANRRTMAVEAINPAALVDPAGLILNAAANIQTGRVKLSATALERSRDRPLLGALAVVPGEVVTNNPLRVALLLGVAELDPAPSRRPAAMINFG